ncbi:MAG: DUF1015 domain-containing protein [ANME-2 cluster archaeon]|nr:DUF1015 domain-containing protein [ANME-2 cluster archaeon]MBC2707756.1 DUF1015 domain-containing protein [ANME-2 cluster archaeon]MBC2748392.1 DUF1015 domain-containing protein [ANME-2 cluster archaeon]MBC2764140.1 DUF1015 domain-containing protein [ANME-2 cluster archaeon]
MVTIKPFKTTLINPQLSQRDRLVCPVYDTIDETEYGRYGGEENNVINITTRRAGVDSEEFIANAKRCLKRFFDEQILVERDEPALYIYGIKYTLSENILSQIPEIARRNIYFAFGLVGLVKVEELGRGSIVGHERIFEKHTIERYNLMKACGMNFSPIVSEYNMPGHEINNILEDYLGFKRPDLVLREERPPLVDLELKGTRHLLWEITETEIIGKIQQLMKDEKVLILDGHHRYNAANELRMKDGVDHTMMMFMEGGDRALLLLPWHRVVRHVDVGKLGLQVKRYFETIREGELDDGFHTALQDSDGKYDVRIGLYDGETFSVLKANKEDVKRLSVELGENVGLDYIALNEWIIGPCVDNCNTDDVVFVDSMDEAVNKVDTQGFDMAFLIRPLAIEDVEYKAHVEMNNFPQKSTLFLPKVAEGIMMRRF